MSDAGRPPSRAQLSVGEYVEGVVQQDRTVLARTLTLVESVHAEDLAIAREVLMRLLPRTGQARRMGISGAPGVGKSTFIDAFGTQLAGSGQRVAVLAVDPSSAISGGSILGDKSRMPRLASNPQAFVRPSPNALTAGGVGRRTRESMLICEAAGYDVVLVETVGVGQAEFMVAQMVDFFVVLLLAGAGDELQGIKKGILEMADLLAVNKADGPDRERVLAARAEFEAAMRYLPIGSADWRTPVLAISAVTGEGLAELWEMVVEHSRIQQASGAFQRRRRQQNLGWMWSLIDERLKESFRRSPQVERRLPELESEVLAGRLSATQAAEELLALFRAAESTD